MFLISQNLISKWDQQFTFVNVDCYRFFLQKIYIYRPYYYELFIENCKLAMLQVSLTFFSEYVEYSFKTMRLDCLPDML